MFSNKDKEMMEYIRSLFRLNGELPEYDEQTNAILLTIVGDQEPHPVLIGCYAGILKISTTRRIPAGDSSVTLLKQVFGINQILLLGSFYYSANTNDFGYSASITIEGMPTKEFLLFVLFHVRCILDIFIPEIISCASMLYNSKDWDNNPTLH